MCRYIDIFKIQDPSEVPHQKEGKRLSEDWFLGHSNIWSWGSKDKPAKETEEEQNLQRFPYRQEKEAFAKGKTNWHDKRCWRSKSGKDWKLAMTFSHVEVIDDIDLGNFGEIRKWTSMV